MASSRRWPGYATCCAKPRSSSPPAAGRTCTLSVQTGTADQLALARRRHALTSAEGRLRRHVRGDRHGQMTWLRKSARGPAGGRRHGRILRQRRVHQGPQHPGADRPADGGARRVRGGADAGDPALAGPAHRLARALHLAARRRRGRRHLHVPGRPRAPADRRHLHPLLRRPPAAHRRCRAAPRRAGRPAPLGRRAGGLSRASWSCWACRGNGRRPP